MEIERKFLVKSLPKNLEKYKKNQIEQAYLCTNPVVRIRRKNEAYILTYKSNGMLARVEEEMPLTKEGYEHLRQKADGNIILKHRYIIPQDDGLAIELDCFEGVFSGFVMAEVEFPTVEEANAYQPPEWFLEEVTFDPNCHNSSMSKMSEEQIKKFLEKYANRGNESD